jgi:hypothetical protein
MTAQITAIAALILAAAAVAGLVLVVIGARHEPPGDLLPGRPPGLLPRLARRVLGLHVRHATASTEQTRHRRPSRRATPVDDGAEEMGMGQGQCPPATGPGR